MDNILNSTVEMSQAELILQLAKTNVEQEKRLKTTELRLSALEEEIKKLSSKCIGNYGCSTMSSYIQRYKLPIYVSDISKLSNDAQAVTFQTLGQYRSWLMKTINELDYPIPEL